MSSTVRGSGEDDRLQALAAHRAVDDIRERRSGPVMGAVGEYGDFVAASERTLHDVARSALLEADFAATGLIRRGAAEAGSRQ